MKNIQRYFMIFGFLLLICTSCTNKESFSKETSIETFFPKEPFIKYFDGGFENFGEVELIDKVSKDYYQKKSLNLATGTAHLYYLSDDKIIKVYINETEKFKDDYFKEKKNTAVIQLQAPIEVGTQWPIYGDNLSEITAINIEIETPYATFNCIEVTSYLNNSEVKYYYTKDIGLVKTIFSNYYASSLIYIDKDISSININNVDETLNHLYEKNNSKGGK